LSRRDQGLTPEPCGANHLAMNYPRFGIRGKILGFYGATLAIVVALEIIAQDTAIGAGRDFEERLGRYYAVQRLRSSLEEFRVLGDLYMREGLPEEAAALQASLGDILSRAPSLAPLGADSQDAFFEARATKRGLDAWKPLVEGALAKRAAYAPDAYQDYAKADRVAAFVDGYLSKLLSISMATGAARYRDAAARSAGSRRLALIGLVGGGALALALALVAAALEELQELRQDVHGHGPVEAGEGRQGALQGQDEHLGLLEVRGPAQEAQGGLHGAHFLEGRGEGDDAAAERR